MEKIRVWSGLRFRVRRLMAHHFVIRMNLYLSRGSKLRILSRRRNFRGERSGRRDRNSYGWKFAALSGSGRLYGKWNDNSGNGESTGKGLKCVLSRKCPPLGVHSRFSIEVPRLTARNRENSELLRTDKSLMI